MRNRADWVSHLANDITGMLLEMVLTLAMVAVGLLIAVAVLGGRF